MSCGLLESKTTLFCVISYASNLIQEVIFQPFSLPNKGFQRINLMFKPLLDDKIPALSKLKAVVENKLNVTQNIEVVFNWVKNTVRKYWLPAFSPLPKMFSKCSFLRSVKRCHCVVKG